MNKKMIKKIEEVIAKANAKTNKEEARLSHTITMAVGQGTMLPVKSLEWALNKHNAVMFRIGTMLPTPIFINIQNNFLKKNTPAEEEATGKKNVVIKELSVYNFGKLVENYFSIKGSKDPAFAINTIANNTNYIFFREMIENLDIISENFNINLTEMATQVANLGETDTDVELLTKEQLDIISMIMPEKAEIEDVVRTTKWHQIEVPEGATIPVYSTGKFVNHTWDNFSLDITAPFQRDNTFWKSTYTNLDNNTEEQQEEAVKLAKEIREMKDAIRA